MDDMKKLWPTIAAAILLGILLGVAGLEAIAFAKTIGREGLVRWASIAGVGLFALATSYAQWRASRNWEPPTYAELWTFGKWALGVAAVIVVGYGVLRYFIPMALALLMEVESCNTRGNCNTITENGAFKLISGIIVFVGGTLALIYTARRANAQVRAAEAQVLATREQAKATEHRAQELMMSRRAQLTSRFAEAVKNLGDASISVRIGAIAALYSMASESDNFEDNMMVMDVICGFIRESSRNRIEGEPPTDILMAVEKVFKVGGLYRKGANYTRNIGGADLSLINARDLDFEGTDMTNVKLCGASIYQSNIKSAKFARSDLSDATFVNCKLSDSFFYSAKLDDADFHDCDLDGARLAHTTCAKATFRSCDLTESAFMSCQLYGADFRFSICKETEFTDSNMNGVDFSDTILAGARITKEQYSGAVTSDLTIPPANFVEDAVLSHN